MSDATDPGSRKPRLLVFYADEEQDLRRIEGYLEQVLRSGEIFVVDRIKLSDPGDVPRMAPGLVVLVRGVVRAVLREPRSPDAIARVLEPWLGDTRLAS